MVMRLAFAALLVISTLNREMTGVLLWLAFAVMYPREWRWWLLYGVLLVSVFAGLRLFVPITADPFTIRTVLQANLTDWRLQGAMQYQGLLLPLWVLLYYRAQGDMRWRAAAILIPYLVLVAVFGYWQEVRLLMPLFILGIPFLRDEKPK